jgi:hypothetical protein
MLGRKKAATEKFANPELVRELEEKQRQAGMEFMAISGGVLRGKNTEEEKQAAAQASSDAVAALKAEQKNVVPV